MKTLGMKKNIVLYILFFCLILGLSACSERRPNSGNTDDWENEVLWADECGQDGLACCLDENPSCKFGQTCCVSPLDPQKTYCADECNFGELDEFCRQSEPFCNEGMICADYGRCAPCGDPEQMCCGGETRCNGSLICSKNICEECGLPGNVCCEKGLACLDENKRETGRTECQINNICSYCGSEDQIACQNEPRCADSHLLSNELCYHCGEINQPCCKNENKENYCNQDDGLNCSLGFCSK